MLAVNSPLKVLKKVQSGVICRCAWIKGGLNFKTSTYVIADTF